MWGSLRKSQSAKSVFFSTVRLGAVALATALVTTDLQAANSVVMESKWVEGGEQNVHLGIHVTNDDSLDAIVLPLEFRAIHVGSFITRALSITATSRMSYFESSEEWINKLYYPRRRSAENLGSGCPADSAGGIWAWNQYDSLPDFLGEEAMMYAAVLTHPLPPGSDGAPGDGDPSLLLSFDVTDVGGAFVVDTTCTAIFNHLAFVVTDPAQSVRMDVPSFERAIILIGCGAECHADPFCDGICDVVDLIKTVNVVFKNAPPVIDPDPRCPVENTDYNCDAVTDVVDVVKVTNVLYRRASLETEFCRACEHIPRSGDPKRDVQTPYFRRPGS